MPQHPPQEHRGFYGALTPESRHKLHRLERVRSYHPGQVIYSRDAPNAHVRILLEGSVKLTAISPGSRETLLEIRTRGDLLGEREALYSTVHAPLAASGHSPARSWPSPPASTGRPTATALWLT